MKDNKVVKPTDGPENYARAIISLSKRYTSTSVFPGNNYVDLAEWILQDRNILRTKSGLSPKPPSLVHRAGATHDLVVVYYNADKKWHIEGYDSEKSQELHGDMHISAGDVGQIVFIRGFISPRWVSTVGSKYNVDPEFFRRHMDFLSYRAQQLRSSKITCGDSVVREYATLCSSFSIIEQWISLCVTKNTRGWTVVVWMDHGRPLEQSPPGPWTSHVLNKATPIPIIQHHPKMAFRTTTNRLKPEMNEASHTMQSTAVLPLQYDSIIALVDLARKAPTEPLSMCIPLFAHAAYSEVQFLNLMQAKIESYIEKMTDAVTTDVLSSLQYFSKILTRHAQQLKHSIFALDRLADRSAQQLHGMKSESTGPRSATGIQPTIDAEIGAPPSFQVGNNGGSFTVKGLLDDYEDLRERCINLSKLCSRGITLAMNRSIIDESRRAVEQSERVKKLTILATIFIPLGFCSSLFGMNIDILGQGSVEFWWFFVVCVPITLLAYVFYLWDSGAVIRWALRICIRGGQRRDSFKLP
ncbi:hypothetical protein LMH87_001619 [Akanthomyces muscarius]|uniref:Uncharacterized protein n=1 Tax=Akanthomyces muscarius TaxID=2231603 RepID=A0A9W8UIL1_AKAMU|nr:hypothetical protein LMH87_001619 [Akanthomyces muscarius]KAJ4147069.1 hypothetical protein LMH87_001619 [Akanthomyces muscarius]